MDHFLRVSFTRFTGSQMEDELMNVFSVCEGFDVLDMGPFILETGPS